MFLNQSTASLRRLPFELVDSGGAAVTGQTFSGAELQLSKAGGAYANCAGTATEIGLGSYYYELTTGEVNTLGMLILRANKSGATVYKFFDEVITAPSTITVADVWNFAHLSGRTAKGVLKRLDQLITGKHTGLIGALWTLFDTDDTTVLVQATQNISTGARSKASTVAGD